MTDRFALDPFSMMDAELEHLWQNGLNLIDINRIANTGKNWLPETDITADKGKVTITMNLNGIREEDLYAEVKGKTLYITGTKRYMDENMTPGSGRATTFGRFTRSFMLPTGTDVKDVHASLQDGKLTVMMPIAEQTRAVIPIEHVQNVTKQPMLEEAGNYLGS